MNILFHTRIITFVVLSLSSFVTKSELFCVGPDGFKNKCKDAVQKICSESTDNGLMSIPAMQKICGPYEEKCNALVSDNRGHNSHVRIHQRDPTNASHIYLDPDQFKCDENFLIYLAHEANHAGENCLKIPHETLKCPDGKKRDSYEISSVQVQNAAAALNPEEHSCCIRRDYNGCWPDDAGSPNEISENDPGIADPNIKQCDVLAHQHFREIDSPDSRKLHDPSSYIVRADESKVLDTSFSENGELKLHGDLNTQENTLGRIINGRGVGLYYHPKEYEDRMYTKEPQCFLVKFTIDGSSWSLSTPNHYKYGQWIGNSLHTNFVSPAIKQVLSNSVNLSGPSNFDVTREFIYRTYRDDIEPVSDEYPYTSKYPMSASIVNDSLLAQGIYETTGEYTRTVKRLTPQECINFILNKTYPLFPE